jgi:hypothetical protein
MGGTVCASAFPFALLPLCGRKSGANGGVNTDIQGWLVVCEYYPPGNVLGADGDTQYFEDNVLEQTEGQETDTVESGVTSASRGWDDTRWGVGVLIAAGFVGLGIGW